MEENVSRDPLSISTHVIAVAQDILDRTVLMVSMKHKSFSRKLIRST